MSYKCVDERWDDGTSVYDSIKEFCDMCREVHGEAPQLYPLDADGTVREVGGDAVLAHADGGDTPFSGWTQIGEYRMHRESPGAYAVYERSGVAYVRRDLAKGRTPQAALRRYLDGL